jgi:hypothetical protein
LGDGLWHCFTHIISSVFFLPNSAVLLLEAYQGTGICQVWKCAMLRYHHHSWLMSLALLKPSIGSFFLVNFFLHGGVGNLWRTRRGWRLGGAYGIYLENPLVSGRRVNFGQETRGPTDTLHFFWISLALAFRPWEPPNFELQKLCFFPTPKTANNYGRWRDGITFLGSEKPSQGLVEYVGSIQSMGSLGWGEWTIGMAWMNYFSCF